MSCKLKTTTVEGVPQWAVNYFEYGDESGISAEDKKMADQWYEKISSGGLHLIFPIDGSENEFNPSPAFGLACSTVDYTAEVLPKEYDVYFTEKFVCKVRVKAHSKKEAIAAASSYLDGGSEAWESQGIKFKSCIRSED